MEEPKNIKDIFCSKHQAVTPHKGSVDANGEFLFECIAETAETEEFTNQVGEKETRPVPCGRFVKFPADTTPEKFAELLGKHEEVNVGQVSMEGQEKTLSLLLAVDQKASDGTPEAPAEQPAEETPGANGAGGGGTNGQA